MAGRGRQGVDYIKPKEPSFLTKFKREMGYKEGPTVNSKKATLPLDEDDDRPDGDDEQPLVVVLKDGDLTKEEYDEQINHDKEEETGTSTTSSSSLPGKLSFKKPSKRTSQESPGVQFGSSKKKNKDKDKEKDKDKNKQSNKRKKIKNESLLSFTDEDDET